MTLHDYIQRLAKDAREAMATRCGTSLGHLLQVAYGNRRASANLAIAIDRETCGRVPCETTRPDIEWGYLRSRDAA